MLSSFISYIPKGPKRKTKNLANNRLTGQGASGGARGFTDTGENGSHGARASGPVWDHNSSYSNRWASHVLDIRDGNHASSRETRQRPSEEEFLQAPPPASPKLDIDVPSLKLSELLPPELAKGDPFTLLMEAEMIDDPRDGGQRPWVAELGAEGYGLRGEVVGAHEQQTSESLPSATSVSSETVPTQQSASGPAENDDDDESIYSLEYVNFDPDAPHHIQSSEHHEADEGTLLPYAAASRKPVPAPIQIPNLSLYGPQVQLLPTSDHQSRPQSRGNESIVSTEPSSAVSGTSLARALFANTFVLSGNQTSRYRSGVSINLVRQDSATLPRGEHPLMSSPFFGDRAEQYGFPVVIPAGAGVSLPPPSSYRPSTADSTHRRLPRRPGPDSHPRERPKTAPGKRMSAWNLPNNATQDADRPKSATEPATQLDETEERASLGASVDRASRRISRISEVTSSVPSTPDPVSSPQADKEEKEEANEQTEPAASASDDADPVSSPSPSPSVDPRLAAEKDDADIALPQHSPQPSPKVRPEDMPRGELEEVDKHLTDAQPGQVSHQLGAFASPGPTPHSAGGFSISSEPGSGKEIDNVLDYYQFDSQPTTFPNLRLPFSPISEESSSMLSPVSPYQKSSGTSGSGVSMGVDSKMSQQQQDARSSIISASIRARAEWSPRKPSSPPLLPVGGRELPRRPGLLPIGERPKSIQVGPPPISLASPPSSASSSKLGTGTFTASTATTLSSLASPGNDEPLLPPPRNIFNRARSGSAPSPIKVIRTSRDLRRLPVVATPLTGDSSKEEEGVHQPSTADPDKGDSQVANVEDVDRSPSSGGQSVQRSASQEFPETPSAFSPTWTFNMLSPTLRSESTHEYPVLMPMTAGMPGPGIRGSIQPASLTQQVLLTRAATSVRGARHSRQASLLRNATVPAAKIEMTPDGQRVIQPLTEPTEVRLLARPVSLKRPLSEMEEEASPILPGTHHMVTEEPTELEIQLPEEVSPPLRQNSLPEDVTVDDMLFSPRLPTSPTVRPHQRPRMGDPVLPSFFDPPPSVRSVSSGSAPGTPSLSIHSAPSPHDSSHPKDHNHPSSPRSMSPRSVASSSRRPHPSKRSLTSSPHLPTSPVIYQNPASNYSSPHLSPAALQGRTPGTPSIHSAPFRSASPSLSSSSHPSPRLPPPSPARSPVTPFYASHFNHGGASPSSYDSPRSVHQSSPTTRPPPLSLNISSSDQGQTLPIINTPLTSLNSSHPLVSPYTSLPGELDLDHPLSPSFVAPPPYSTVADVHPHQDIHSPFAGVGPEFAFGMAHTPSSANSHAQLEPDPRTPLSAVPRRPRVRPPLPIGPRRPQQTTGHLTTGSLEARQRNASAPNLAGSLPHAGGRHQRQYSTQVPKFRPPAPKWRGYTLEAAKWTFSSAELQAIVSRAIRQSAEASSFRLLQLDTMDNDITQEMELLRTQRVDIRTKYKLLTRRRAGLFDTLSAHLEGAVLEYSVPPLRILDELSDISTSLDQLAEELDSVDEQLSQLTSLCEVHSSSALAMALRKLNTSFLKQVSENSTLKTQIESLEAERDEAWKQAHDVASDYDELTRKFESIPPDSAGRSTRVMASRKTSVRASKAGLRSSSFRRSQRSSVSSIGHRVSVASLPSSTLSPGEVPPVPPMPRRQPFEIITDLPTRASSGVYTPTSETRAMVRAQEELYDMLGISLREGPPALRRSHSVSDRPPELDPSSLRPTMDPSQRYSDTSSAGRRSSMPNNHGLHHVYNAMTVDRKAMLATLGMLSD